jgi:hypothetical protein
MMNAHTARVRILESFDLGKNTGQNSGIKIEVLGMEQDKLGTIQLGQGTFAWRVVRTKTKTKTGKQSPTLSFSWSEFAGLMDAVIALGKNGKKKAMKALAAADEGS